MVVHAKLSALKQGRWYEYLVRFALGEGIEKGPTDFAAEVAAAAGKK